MRSKPVLGYKDVVMIVLVVIIFEEILLPLSIIPLPNLNEKKFLKMESLTVSFF